MTKFGYKLMTEEHGPKALVANAILAEQAGFDFVSASDHFHPWLEAQGHSPFVWSVLGAIAHATETIGITTGLTCPIIRYHPAIVAQAAATVALLSDNRFTLAVGAGERLNEHVTGAVWPPVPERHAMLGEAVDIFRQLWQGGVSTYAGAYFTLDHAQLYDAPEKPIPVVLGVSGPESVELAVEIADGIMTTSPVAELVDGFRKSGKEGPAYAEVALAYSATEEEGRRIAHERFRFSAFDWSVNSELPTVAGFEAATKHIRPEDLAETISAGPDPEVHLKAIRKYLDAGFDHIVLTGIGDDQQGFTRFFAEELLPELKRGG
ncbi:TIGR03557 family F420-dependent LLM class oxidoreductase [Novosphingobium sp. JCM 18896]|uniref:TIGR03557 family F420-dependent LLM class oxidoreductase n=1 Tax=Novosphingobium sp. JCM 18896 TaxID=2989731 RepID=UPI0022228B4A|nr:TIGR03557 family F420-dependent LLM class oxidoreductase [Novosphingobium sp. JCM 18896]MCW1429793.1 TIGR03557 family F420-dependent LLM class oxidoreductase [Novosphingobium sp. JCM 18896]